MSNIPHHKWEPEAVRALRRRYGRGSREDFVKLIEEISGLHITASSLKNWETGANYPSQKNLDILDALAWGLEMAPFKLEERRASRRNR